MQSPPKTAVFESDLAPLLSAFVAEKQRFGFKYNSTEAYLKSFDKVPLVLQLKSVKQGKHLPGDFKGMVFVLTICEFQIVARMFCVEPNCKNGIGIVLVFSALWARIFIFRMVSIHDIFLRFDLNF